MTHVVPSRQTLANVCHTGPRLERERDPAKEPRRAATAAGAAARRLGWSGRVGVLGYVLAVMQRTTFGVAGLDAADRFAIEPGHAVGVRVHPGRRLHRGADPGRPAGGPLRLAGHAGGQRRCCWPPASCCWRSPPRCRWPCWPGCWSAPVTRSCSSPCSAWSRAGSRPGGCRVITQLTGILCQVGQVLSAVPFVGAAALAGWTAAFGRGRRGERGGRRAGLRRGAQRARRGLVARRRAVSPREIGRQLRAVWRRPGTRLGFFGHMGTQFSMMVFTLLWGVPYLVTAQQLSPAAVGALLTLFVVCMIGIGPVAGGAHRAAPAAPVLAGARGDRRGGRGLDGGAGPARARRRCGCWCC